MAILGIDEVGRGAWAGPLVVGAVVLSQPIDGLADSKLLTKKRREELSGVILNSGAAIGLGWVPAAEIDATGLSAALKLATRRAVEQIKAPYHEIIIDGTINFLSETSKGRYVTTLKKADQLIGAVSAASIVAKVARDAYMVELGARRPSYGFAGHVGYGTAAHRAALAKLGPCDEHRLSFKPLRKLASGYLTRSSARGSLRGSPAGRPGQVLTVINPQANSLAEITTKQVGDKAESIVAEYLQNTGHSIVARNWKTRTCEIDIVSEKSGRLYFVEVKYRKTAKWGSGLDAVTPQKRSQMEFASEVFVKTNGLADVDRCLAVANVAGPDYEVKDFMVLI